MKKVISLLLAVSVIFTLSAGLFMHANAVNATALQFNQTYNSSIKYYSTKDYSFKVPAKGEINVKVIKNKSASLKVDIFDSNYEPVCSFQNYKYNELTELYTFDLVYALAAGNYYLRLDNGYADQSYQLTVTFKQSAAKPTSFALPSNGVKALQIELGETIRTTIPSYTNQNYVFNTKMSGTMSLVVNKKVNASLRISLFDSKSNKLTEFNDYDGNEMTNIYTLKAQYYITPGVYYLRAESSFIGAEMQQYSIGLNLKPSIAVPGGFKCVARTTNSQKVSWNKVKGVTGYQVQCSDGGTKWAQNKSGTGTDAAFKGLIAGGKYKFRVRAYKRIDGVNYFGAWSPVLNSCAKPATVKLKSVTSPKHTQIKTTWAKAGGVVTGYQIVYARNKACTNLAAVKNVAGKNTVTYTGKNFTKGRAYYVRVRAYTTFSGKAYYGAWSALKAVKSK